MIHNQSIKSLFFLYIFISFFSSQKTFPQEGPLGEWPDFTPLGFITAPHPQNPNVQTHLYGDWGGIVGEEFLAIEDSLLKLFYHSYHETYLTTHLHKPDLLSGWELGYDPVTYEKLTPLVSPGGPIPDRHGRTPIHRRISNIPLRVNT